MCRYLLSKGPQKQLQFEGNLLSKGPPTATEMCKYSAFKLHWKGLEETVMCKHSTCKGSPNSNYNVKFHAFKEAPTAVVMCKYLTFKGAPNNNCNVSVPCFQRGPQQQLQCLCTLLSKGSPRATVICNCLAFKGATNSNCNVQVGLPCFQRGPQQQL